MPVTVEVFSAHDLLIKHLCKRSLPSEEPAKSEKISGLLSIPEYQRPYCWTETQVQQLLNDLRSALDHSQNTELQGHACPYYLGSIILHKSNHTLNIIDGQQRLTTLALIAFELCYIANKLPNPNTLQSAHQQYKNIAFRFQSPESQRQIKHNLHWLKNNTALFEHTDLSRISVTLVVTDSEDEAYSFFETQNTGGVRLKGPDIIKAHHLRAIGLSNKRAIDDFAVLWESLGDLSPVIDLILRGRYWQHLGWRDYPKKNQSDRVRQVIVEELANNTEHGEDIAYGRITRQQLPNGGERSTQLALGYELRQPLNSGANLIHYLRYFESLRQRYLIPSPDADYNSQQSYHDFYSGLISKLDNCDHLKKLYDACLLTYISQFGDEHLYPAAIKLFRVVYSLRVSNANTVRENSVSHFAKATPVLDWIALSYTHKELFKKLDKFELNIHQDGLLPSNSGVKKQFAQKVNQQLSLGVNLPSTTEKAYDTAAMVADFKEQWNRQAKELGASRDI